jgi:hypothetical protein
VQNARLVQCSETENALADCIKKASRVCPAKFDVLISEGLLDPTKASNPASGPRIAARCHEVPAT